MTVKGLSVLFRTDAYKLDHRRQYPAGTEMVYSNYTNRGSRIPGVDHVIHFGLLAFLRDLNEEFQEFFDGDIDEIAPAYEERVNSILGPNDVGSGHIRALHALGYLPLTVYSLPEGTAVPLRVPSFTIVNTHPDFFWLVNYLETWISAAVWQASTSATIAYNFRKLLNEAALETAGTTEGVEFQGHDFSFRGMPGVESAGASGAGHLLSFRGSDSLTSIDWIEKHYPSNPVSDNGWILGSVPATEHSVMCAGGEDGEQDTFERLLHLYPSGILSVVSDTWNLWTVLTEFLPNLKEEILARDGKLVIRPDSGDPVDILCGTDRLPAVSGIDGAWDTPEQRGVIQLLWDVFGGTINEQGYKVLDPHIGAIYGDSITYDRAQQIINRLAAKGFASTNVVFGVGSYTYQYQTRDTFMSAMKATYVQINGEGHKIRKDPITDNGTKRSATGMLVVTKNIAGELQLVDGMDALEWAFVPDDELKLVYMNGRIAEQSFAQVRARVGEVV